ncbi:hypothetical protein FRC09_010030 [Ceratobasidium sp. 395]|nr:hypothetical protein FRC09_010030 [Ceratobasidium sp. 395]
MAAVVWRAVWFGVKSLRAASFGAGKTVVTRISSGTVFAGRSIGGGSRDQVYGNRRYGSGYTYGDKGTSVAGRGFPFGYWPNFIPVARTALEYYGSEEFGPASNKSRPGGAMQYAVIRSKDWPSNNSKPINNATASYYIVGDADSVSAVMDAIVADCLVKNVTGQPFDDDNSVVHDEQAVQYYRASSFMLALSSYNNTANLASSAPSNNKPPPAMDTPLPPGTDRRFLVCLNVTIGNALPIIETNAAPDVLQAAGGLNVVGLLWLLIWLLKIF